MNKKLLIGLMILLLVPIVSALPVTYHGTIFSEDNDCVPVVLETSEAVVNGCYNDSFVLQLTSNEDEVVVLTVDGEKYNEFLQPPMASTQELIIHHPKLADGESSTDEIHCESGDLCADSDALNAGTCGVCEYETTTNPSTNTNSGGTGGSGGFINYETILNNSGEEEVDGQAEGGADEHLNLSTTKEEEKTITKEEKEEEEVVIEEKNSDFLDNLIATIIIILGGVYYYFKVYKKQEDEDEK